MPGVEANLCRLNETNLFRSYSRTHPVRNIRASVAVLYTNAPNVAPRVTVQTVVLICRNAIGVLHFRSAFAIDPAPRKLLTIASMAL